MKIKMLLLCSTIVFPFLCSAQIVEFSLNDHFLKLPDSVNCIMLGEEHSRPNIESQLEIIRTIYDSKGVKHVFLELPRTCQLEVDLYLNGKIEEPKTISRYQRKNYIMNMLEGFKRAFSVEIASGNIIFHCFDVEWDKKIVERFSSSIQYIVNPKLDKLKPLLTNPPKELEENIKQGELILKELQRDSALYRVIFGKYYQSLYVGLKENLIISSVPDVYFSFDVAEFREHAMDSTIRSIIDFKKDKAIILTGMDHVRIMSNQEFKYGEPRTLKSLYERLEMGEDTKIVRYNFLYMPNRFSRGLIFTTIEKHLDRKKWMHLLKKKKYLICAVDQVSEEDFSEIGDYFIMTNLRRR